MTVHGVKEFRETFKVCLAPVTLVCGMNRSGRSTFMNIFRRFSEIKECGSGTWCSYGPQLDQLKLATDDERLSVSFKCDLVTDMSPFDLSNEYNFTAEECSINGKHATFNDVRNHKLLSCFNKEKTSVTEDEVFGKTSHIMCGIDIKADKGGKQCWDYGTVEHTVSEILSLPEDGFECLSCPERGLTPKGQNRIGELLIETALKRNCQIVVKTNSDHIINALRIAVREGTLKPEDALILWFSRENGEKSEIAPIEINKYGSPSDYPDGFLDGMTEQLLKLC